MVKLAEDKRIVYGDLLRKKEKLLNKGKKEIKEINNDVSYLDKVMQVKKDESVSLNDNNNTSVNEASYISVINYDTNNTNSSFVFVDIYFENGVNSKTLSNEFKEYKDEYLVKKISVNNKLIVG